MSILIWTAVLMCYWVLPLYAMLLTCFALQAMWLKLLFVAGMCKSCADDVTEGLRCLHWIRMNCLLPLPLRNGLFCSVFARASYEMMYLHELDMKWSLVFLFFVFNVCHVDAFEIIVCTIKHHSFIHNQPLHGNFSFALPPLDSSSGNLRVFFVQSLHGWQDVDERKTFQPCLSCLWDKTCLFSYLYLWNGNLYQDKGFII